MKEDMYYIAATIVLVILGLVIFIVIRGDNKKIYSDDIHVAEWVSPDGVHYWYQNTGNTEMLAPRYDRNGNLIIDKESR